MIGKVNPKSLIYFMESVYANGRLSGNDFRVGCYMAAYCHAGDGMLKALSYEEIAHACGVSIDCVDECIETLKDMDLIQESPKKLTSGKIYYRLKGYDDIGDLNSLAKQAVEEFNSAYHHAKRLSGNNDRSRAECIMLQILTESSRPGQLVARMRYLARWKVDTRIKYRGSDQSEAQAIAYLPRVINYLEGAGNVVNDLNDKDFLQYEYDSRAREIPPNEISHLSDDQLTEIQKRARELHRKEYWGGISWQK